MLIVMANGQKELVLVLPKTFFANAFLSSRGTESVNDYIEQNHYRFIANLIIEVTSSFPEYRSMAVTTSTALKDFNKLLEHEDLALGSKQILTILEGIMYIEKDLSINKLGDQESMIAIADKLYVSSNTEPVIVINPDSRENYREAAERYYKNNRKHPATTLPFKIYDPRQTKGFLDARYPKESELTIKRTPSPFSVF
jgi:hypothetical protein